VRIRIDSAAVNFPDLLSISGTYPVKSAAPFIPGIEGDRVEMMLGWIAEGRLRPHIHQRFPFDRCVEALEALAARKIVGKGVIVIRSGQGMTA
jgi:NADPH:quinone reductase-like Zn-dependent oxidoreductase